MITDALQLLWLSLSYSAKKTYILFIFVFIKAKHLKLCKLWVIAKWKEKHHFSPFSQLFTTLCYYVKKNPIKYLLQLVVLLH